MHNRALVNINEFLCRGIVAKSCWMLCSIITIPNTRHIESQYQQQLRFSSYCKRRSATVLQRYPPDSRLWSKKCIKDFEKIPGRYDVGV